MKENIVGWFEIYVDNMERAKKFYESVFGGKLDSTKIAMPGLEMALFPGNVKDYGAHGALVKMAGFSAGKNSVLVYFSCEDCAHEEKRVTQFGGRVEKSKFSIGEHGFIALVQDTEGNMIGLHSMK